MVSHPVITFLVGLLLGILLCHTGVVEAEHDSVELVPRWNLVAYHGETCQFLSQLPPSVGLVGRFLPETQEWLMWTPNGSTGVVDMVAVCPGQIVWVHTTEPATWTFW